MDALIESPILRFIPAIPLAVALGVGVSLAVFRRTPSGRWVAVALCTALIGSFALSAVAFVDLVGLASERGERTEQIVDVLYTWLGAGVGRAAFSADLAFRFDPLSAVMCFVVTGVGLLVAVYAVGFIERDARDDGGPARFFGTLALSVFALLVLVLADNLLLLFLGWQLASVSSTLLIGFWYGESANASAGAQAFVVNRLGDAGLLLGILVLFWATAESGTPAVSFAAIEASFGAIAAQALVLPDWMGGGAWPVPEVAGLLIFTGVVARSAQWPLQRWLPDAMTGPAPASAYLHGATLVVAGVYLLVRLSFLYEEAPLARSVIAWVGGSSAFLAAAAACVQTDLRRVLAWSTVGQVGLMLAAVGVGAYTLAIFHAVAHAFFKTLLMLAAGVIVLEIGPRSLLETGGLRRRLIRTWGVMLVGSLTLAGLPPLSAFFSQQEILGAVFWRAELPGHLWLHGLLLASVGLTSFYIARAFILVFHVKSRLPRGSRARIEDPNDWMQLPLYALAALAMLAGLLGVPQLFGDTMGIENSDSLGHFLSRVVVMRPLEVPESGLPALLIVLTLAATAAGFSAAYTLYVSRPKLRTRLVDSAPMRALTRLRELDALDRMLVVRPLLRFADGFLWRRVDERWIEGRLAGGLAESVRGLALGSRRWLQPGYVQGSLIASVVGAAVIVFYLLGGAG